MYLDLVISVVISMSNLISGSLIRINKIYLRIYILNFFLVELIIDVFK